MPVLKRELNEFKHRWNNHRIRFNRFASCPSDTPNDVYYLSNYLGMAHVIACVQVLTLFSFFKMVITSVTLILIFSLIAWCMLHMIHHHFNC